MADDITPRGRGAPIGNTNGAKRNRLWTDALKRHAAQNPEAMAKIAKKVFQLAMEGDMQAVKEIGDRIDGKPVQAVEIEHDDNQPLSAEMRKQLTDDALERIVAAHLKPDSGTIQ